MTGQDADDAETESDAESADQGGDSSAARSEAEQGSHAGTDSSDSIDSVLSSIAREPEGDIEEILDAIESTDAPTDAPTEDGDADDSDPAADVGVAGSGDTGDVTVNDALLEDIEEASTERLGAILVTLRAKIDHLETELEHERERADELESRLRRKQADFQNYKRRQQERLEEEKQRATEDLVRRLLDIRDNLARALDQGEDAGIRSGIESTLDQFDQQLDRENVESIEPTPGEGTDPRRHEVLATIASDQPADTIAQVHRPGYEMAGKVLRPAQVAVSDGSRAEEANPDDSGDTESAPE
jgi:molecular chaperone GrpE